MATELSDLINYEEYLRIKEECAKLDSTNPQVVATSMHNWQLGMPLSQNSTSHLSNRAALRVILSRKSEFNPSRDKPVFYDLGCGIGTLVIYAAHDGWYGTGAEFDEEHFRGALINIDNAVKAGFIDKNYAMVAHGNFFPEGFKVRELNPKIDEFRKYLKSREKISQRIDISTLFGIDLSEVDLFYHFQVESKDNILRFFADYARKGSVLAFVSTMPDKADMPRGIHPAGSFNTLSFYRKG